MRIIRMTLIATLLITGCAAPGVKKFNDTACNNVDIVLVKPTTTVERQMYYSGPLSLRFVGATSLDLISEFANKMGVVHSLLPLAGLPFQFFAEYLRIAETAKYQTYIEQKNNIRIDYILHNELISQLRKSGILKYDNLETEDIDSDDARLKIDIIRFGFSNEFLSSNLKPELVVQASLHDTSDRLICLQKYSYSVSDSVFAVITFEQFEKEPERIEASWSEASKVVVSKIVSDLAKRN